MRTKLAEEGELEVIQAAIMGPPEAGGDAQRLKTSEKKGACSLEPKETGCSLTLMGAKPTTQNVLPQFPPHCCW